MWWVRIIILGTSRGLPMSTSSRIVQERGQSALIAMTSRLQYSPGEEEGKLSDIKTNLWILYYNEYNRNFYKPLHQMFVCMNC